MQITQPPPRYIPGGGRIIDVTGGGTGSSTAPDARTVLGTPAQVAAAHPATPLNDPSLFGLHRAWALRASAPVKILWVGDSQIALSAVNRVVNVALADQVNPPNRAFTVTGSGGYPATGTQYPGDSTTGVGGSVPAWTSTTGVAQGDVVANRGMAGSALALANLDDLTSPSMLCTSVKFHWLTPLSGSGATLDFYVDGALTAPNTGISAAAAGSHTISNLSASSAHTVKIVSHGVTLFDRVQVFYGNESAYIQPYAAGHSGTSVGSFNDYTDFAAAATAIDPDLIIIEAFTNYSAAPLLAAADTATLVTTLQTATDASICLLLPPATLGDTFWFAMQQQIRKVADRYGCLFVDLTDVVPDLSAADAESYTSDGVHFNALGRSVVGLATYRGIFGGQRPSGARRRTSPTDAAIGPSRQDRNCFSHFEDFDTAVTTSAALVGSKGFRARLAGTGAQISQIQTTAATDGAAGLEVGTSGTGECTLYWSALPITWDPTQPQAMGIRARIPVLSAGAQTFDWRFGLSTVFNGLGTDAIVVGALNGTANFVTTTRAASTSTSVTSSIAVPTSFFELRIDYDPATAAVRFWFANPTTMALLASATLTIPAAGALLIPQVHMVGLAGATNKLSYVDLMAGNFIESGARNLLLP